MTSLDSVQMQDPIVESQQREHFRVTLAPDIDNRQRSEVQPRDTRGANIVEVDLGDLSIQDRDAVVIATSPTTTRPTKHSLADPTAQDPRRETTMPILPGNYVPASPVSSSPPHIYNVTVPAPPQYGFSGRSSEITPTQTYLIVGASRGIGLAFVRALLAQDHQVIAVVRRPESASQVWQLMPSCSRPHQCIMKQCDVTDPASIDQFIDEMCTFVTAGGRIDHIILNAGILRYNEGIGAMKVSFHELMAHLSTNCTGAIVTARKLLELNELDAVKRQRRQMYEANGESQDYIIGRQTVFISSDSGSMADFREYEDGFAAYAASKAALNMMIRHMAAELKRVKGDVSANMKQRNTSISTPLLFTGMPTPSPDQNTFTQTRRSAPSDDVQSRCKRMRIEHLTEPLPPWQSKVCVLAMHPGEVQTDMANIELPYEVEGVIGPDESIRDMLDVLRGKDERFSGTFWRWDGKEHPW